jgi:hypothetical protein
MNFKFLLAVVAALIAGFCLGGLIYGVILADFFKSMMAGIPPGVMTDPPAMWGIILANLCSATLVTWLLHSMNVNKFLPGLYKGLLIGVLIAMSFDFFMSASMPFMTFSFFIVDVLCSTCITGLMGAVSALVLGMGNK